MKQRLRRWQEATIKTALQSSRIVNVTGARQVGKTTVTKLLGLENAVFRTLDDGASLEFARTDPKTFLLHDEQQTLVIDEIQKAPELLSAMKMAVDECDDPGQFLITGSADLKTLPSVRESLAGRMRSVRLRTFTAGELRGQESDFLGRLFGEGFEPVRLSGDKRSALRRAFRGGYPEAVRLDGENRADWFDAYIDALLTHDIADVSDIRRTDVLRKVFDFLLSRSSKIWNVQEVTTAIGISRPAIEAQIAALKRMYLFDEVPAWTDNDYRRSVLKAKYFATDTGLMAHALGWDESTVLFDSDKSGKVIETLVYQELAAAADLEHGVRIMHYRDRDAREIDFLLANRKGELAAVEVKSSATAHSEDFKTIKWFDEHIHPLVGKVVIYCGDTTVSFGDGCWACPLALLS